MQTQRLFVVLTLGLGLTLGLLWVLGSQPEAVRAGTLCVKPGGGTGCYASIQAAVNAANDGDTIRVAQGTYSETVVVSKSITLEGGWNSTFTVRDWNLYEATINAQRAGPVIRAEGAVSPTIEGFVITGGDASAFLGWGGGILIHGDGMGPGLATIRHNVIYDNIACQTGSCQGYGGGIMVYSSQSVIEYNKIISNLASVSGSLGGQGGGIAIWGYDDSTIAHNAIISNTALFSQTAAFAVGEGGGFWSDYDAVLIDNEIWGNVAAVKGEGYGGGVYAGGHLYNNRILSNTASISGAGYGGGVYAYYVLDFNDNLAQGNVASKSGDGSGGGIYANQLQSAQHNTIVDNIATRGGGLYLGSYSRTGLHYNLIARNRATGVIVSTYDGGGGISSVDDQAEIVGNTIISNTANFLGGGVLLTSGSQYAVHDNIIEGNVAGYGGGVLVYSSTGMIAHNRIVGNMGNTAGGGVYLYTNARPALDGNTVLSNTASLGLGGGFYILIGGSAPVTLTNHLIARNNASTSGAGIHVNDSRGVRLTNNTLVDNSGGSNKEGVKLVNSSRVTMTNNIIVGHSVAISVAVGSTAVLTRNDYWDNTIGVFGQISGTTDMTLDPKFENRAAGDYHLALDSPVIDQGDSSVNVPYDFEGDPRPRGAGIDIGADEAYRAESYVSQITGSDLTGTGSYTQPFATVTRGLTETRTGGTVFVGRGSYTECITITRSVNLLGGYRETDWGRDIAAYGTTLDAARTGTVVTIRGANVQATVEGFTITGGEASVYGLGGGLAIYDDAVATIRYNTITGNHAQNGGGGILLWGNRNVASVVDSNRIYNNVAEGTFVPLDQAYTPQSPQQGPEPGGGLMAAGAARVVNNWIYSNTSGFSGDGMALLGSEGSVQAYHNTVADNGGSSGEGVWLGGDEIVLHNNLIVGHGVGITGTPTTGAVWDYNGFYDNAAAYAPGLAGGVHDVHGNPYFVNRPARNYHIGVASAMAGVGIDVGIAFDADGEARPAPSGTRPDLGADEVSQRRVYLPIVLRN